MAQLSKAMILAAGLGTRLKPVTDKLPKPLVPVLNVPNVLFSLHLVKETGIKDVILNLHYLPESISEFLKDGSPWGMRISYSREEKLLGTGGGVKNAEKFFGNGPFLLVNCDFISNIEIKPIVEKHFSRNALGTMVLLESKRLQSRYSAVGADAEGHLVKLPKLETKTPERQGIFTGIHILSPECFGLLKNAPSGINEVLYPTWMKTAPNKVFVDFAPSDAYWCDTGETNTIWESSIYLLEKLKHNDRMISHALEYYGGLYETKPGIWCPKGETLPSAHFEGPVVLGKSVKIAKGASVGPNVVMGNHSIVGEKATLKNVVGLGACEVFERQNLSECLLYDRQKIFEGR